MPLLEILNQQQTLDRMQHVAHGGDAPDPNAALVTELDNYVQSCWDAAKNAKEAGAEKEIMAGRRARDGVYDADKLQAIRDQGGSEIYMLLVNDKCRAAEAWLRDILLPGGEKPFSVDPTPVPDDMPGDVKASIATQTLQELQQALAAGVYITPKQVYDRSSQLYDQMQVGLRSIAKQRAARMEDAINDVLVEGSFYEALDDMLYDLVTDPSAFMKGPVIRRVKSLSWQQTPDGWQPKVEEKLQPVFYAPDPLDMYPAPDSISLDDGYLCERVRFRRAALFSMIGVPGYSESRIRAALDEYQHGGANVDTASESERRDLQGQADWQSTPDKSLECIEFHGAVRGEWLRKWGMEGVADDDQEFEVTCLKVGRFVVRAVVDENPTGKRPYVSCSYAPVKNSVWGHGVTWLLRDDSAMCNACARALSNNMGMASGPFVEVEVDRLAEGEDVTQMYPWRVFQTKSSKLSASPAIRFNQPQPIIGDLIKVYGYFSKLADEHCGVPNYAEGVNPTQGAAGTASGLSMLMNAATRQIKRVLRSIDGVVEGMVHRCFDHLMLYANNPAIKGDARIRARGANSLVVKEQMQVRRREFLQTVSNPIALDIIGKNGYAALLRGNASTLDIDVDDVVPTKDEMLQREQQQARAQAMQPPGGGAPAMTARAAGVAA